MATKFDEEKHGNLDRYGTIDLQKAIFDPAKQKLLSQLMTGIAAEYHLFPKTIRKRGKPNASNPLLTLDSIPPGYMKARFKKAIDTAGRRGLEWTIEYEKYEEWITANECSYCREVLNKNGIGLDRLDNAQGYSTSNCLPCCYDCNKVKSNVLSKQEMQIAMKAVREYREASEKDQKKMLKKAEK